MRFAVKYGVKAFFSWQVFDHYPQLEVQVNTSARHKEGTLCGK